jgi:putative transcriptional regulator
VEPYNNAHDLLTAKGSVSQERERCGAAKEETAFEAKVSQSNIDVRKLRSDLKLSRPAFAARFGLSVNTIRQWEGGLRYPNGAALVLLRVIERAPDVVSEAIKTELAVPMSS